MSFLATFRDAQCTQRRQMSCFATFRDAQCASRDGQALMLPIVACARGLITGDEGQL